jgi:hypothetical protein
MRTLSTFSAETTSAKTLHWHLHCRTCHVGLALVSSSLQILALALPLRSRCQTQTITAALDTRPYAVLGLNWRQFVKRDDATVEARHIQGAGLINQSRHSDARCLMMLTCHFGPPARSGQAESEPGSSGHGVSRARQTTKWLGCARRAELHVPPGRSHACTQAELLAPGQCQGQYHA